jgi:hypothetical protein
MGAGPLRLASKSEQPRFTYDEERDAAFIDELIQISEDRRTENFGPNYFDWAKEFYLFRPAYWQPQLEYQIKLRLADLQMLLMQEASDLTDVEPNFFISRAGSRDEDREKAFHLNWRAQNFQLEWMKAELWSQICHTGFVEVVPNRPPMGPGVRLRCRNPQSVYPDPFPDDWRDWEYICVRVPMAPDEIVRAFPSCADRLPGLLAEHQREMFLESRLGGVIGAGPMAIQMPPGAMQSVAIGRPPGATDYLAVDYLFIKDESREQLTREIEGNKQRPYLPAPLTRPKYPTGRLIVRCDKLKLWDGPNQLRRFPLIPVFGMPPLFGVWGTPPVQYLIQQQHLAESMMSQHAENMIRLNYGYRVYQDGAVLNPENFDKLGASIRVKTAGDVQQAFRIIPPTPFSSQQTAFPTELLAHMRELYGYTPERSGKVGAGNISPGLLDAGVSNAMAMTRLRARLLADAVEHAGRLVFETMVDWMDDSTLTGALNGDFATAPWAGIPLTEINQWKIELDAASLKPMSSSALRQLVPVMANLGWLTPKYGLRWLGVPHADDIAQDLQQQQREAEMAAIASGGATKPPGKRGKK